MSKQNTEEPVGFSNEDLDLLAYLLAEEGIELEQPPVIQRRAANVDVPLSFAQQRLWFLDQLQPGNPVYNLPTAVRVNGDLNLSALELTFREIVRRHEILRTTFVTVDGTPWQLIAAAAPVEFPLIDLSHFSSDTREAELRRLTHDEVIRPFDLSNGPLMRMLVIRLSDNEHIVIVTMHHIVSDGWSSAILVQEIGALYQEFADDRPSGLAELPLQYADYALWERELMQGEGLQSQLDYWRRQLHDLQVLSLPLDRSRPEAQTFRGAKQTIVMPRATGDALKELGQSEQATLFMVLLAAFAVVLSRYSGQTDITIGTPIANRRRAELESLIGFFANTLVLRLDTADCSSFRELVGRARKICLEAYAHQDLPFEKLVDELQPERSLSHTPLFQTVLVLQNVPRSELNLEGLRMEALPAETSTAKFDLVLLVTEFEQGFACTLEYNTDLFEKETIERLLGHFNTLCGAAATNPDLSLAALPLLNKVERRELFAKWAGTGEDYNRTENLHQLFEEQVARTPNAVAISFEHDKLTYAELNARANRLAHYLRAQGAGPETLVALCVDRSPEMVVAILGILKAGGAYVPLEPTNPKERLAFMLEDSGAPILLTQDHLLDLLPDFEGTSITLDADSEFLLEQNEENPPVTAAAENTAYIIYTSGSTGRPKGTHITHSNVTRLFASTQHWFGFGDTDVWTLFHSYAFDFSVWEIWGALLYGGRLVVVPYWTSRTPEDFYKLLERERVTVLNQTPLAFRQLIHAEEQYSSELALRLVIFGGEALEPGSLKPWIDRHGDEKPQLVNMYGITETTVHVTYRRLLRSDIEGTTGSVIGIPIPDLQVYVLDPMMEPVPIGATGEMYVGGEGLARGYLGRAELTAERFVPHPFSATPGSRLYKTGDLGRYLYTGELEYAGRCDHQVKIRGFRIELGEIQAVLSAHPAVRDAVALSLPDSDGERRLVAYITVREAVAIDQLRAFCRERLPDHMIPAAFVVLDELPITPNGKLDRRALPAPETARLGPIDSYIAPRTETEEVLASIWADVLNLERVGVTDGFFALGGDSILSVRLLAKARERGLEFSLQQLFRRQTIAELAREISMAETPSLPLQETKPFELITEADREKLPPGVVDAYPLTMMQGGMFFHMALSPDTAVYHNVNGWHLRAPFDRECFEESVARAVARHPILRTSFDLTSYSEPLQLVHESATLPVGVTDLRQYSAEEQSELLDQYTESERSHLFDIGCPPLLRFHIHLRTPETFQFSLTESHPIFDGWSLNSTLAEIFTNYFTLLKEHTLPPIVPVSITFRDFVSMERQALHSEECRNFWEERLRGMKVTHLPRLPAAYRPTGGQRIRDEYNQLPLELCQDLDAVARSLKVPLKSVLLAAHQKVLSLLSGESDVVTGFVMNGRPEARDGEEVRGMFLNTVPFRLGISDGTWADLILSTFEAESELLPYRRYPLLALQRQMGGQQLFEAQFTYIRFHVLAGVLSSGDVEVLPDVKRRASEETHFLLSADFAQSPISSQLNLLLQYDSTELAEEQVQAIAGYYLETLRRIAADPLERHNARTSITPAERRHLLSEWNDNSSASYREARLHELLEAQVEPDSVRVVNLTGEPLSEELVGDIYANTHVTIGRQVANTRVYILDGHMEPVPVGVTGELYIGGDGLARGYDNRADLAPERFIPDPFGQEEGARLYRTGDLARYLPDGLVELRGRADSQLKMLGMPANGQQPVAPAVFVAPRNELERTLAQIWCEVLGVEQIGIHDNFFDLGGHSLRLLQMHLKIRETMQRELPLFELFQYPTVNALANHLRTGGDGESLAPSEQRGERRKQQSAQQRQRRRAVAN